MGVAPIMASKGAVHDEKDTASSGSSGKEHVDKFESNKETAAREGIYDLDTSATSNLNAVFENPLAGIPREQLMSDVAAFCDKFGLSEYLHVFQKGALVSQSPANALDLPELDPDERNWLSQEHTNKWRQPWRLYWLVCKLKITNGKSFSIANADRYLSHGFSCRCCPGHG